MWASTRTASPVAVLAFITAAYSLVVASEGAFWWAVLTIAPESPGAAYGFANAVGNVSQFAAPLVLPWIAGRWGWDAAVWSVSVALAGPPRSGVRIPRQSRGPYGVSRSKRLGGVANAAPC